MLVKIHNDAGVTAALTISGPQIAAPGKTTEDRWLEASVVTEAPLTAKLSGQRVEYVVVKLTVARLANGRRRLSSTWGRGHRI